MKQNSMKRVLQRLETDARQIFRNPLANLRVESPVTHSHSDRPAFLVSMSTDFSFRWYLYWNKKFCAVSEHPFVLHVKQVGRSYTE